MQSGNGNPSRVTESPSRRTVVFEFRDGGLQPLDHDPIDYQAHGGDYDKARRAYGFSSMSVPIGPACEDFAMEVWGPAKNDAAPFEFAVDLMIADQWYTIWCRTFVDLHSYLNYAAMMMLTIQMDHIRKTIFNIDHWLFNPGQGMFRDHVCDVQREYEERRAFRKPVPQPE